MHIMNLRTGMKKNVRADTCRNNVKTIEGYKLQYLIKIKILIV